MSLETLYALDQDPPLATLDGADAPAHVVDRLYDTDVAAERRYAAWVEALADGEGS